MPASPLPEPSGALRAVLAVLMLVTIALGPLVGPRLTKSDRTLMKLLIAASGAWALAAIICAWQRTSADLTTVCYWASIEFALFAAWCYYEDDAEDEDGGGGSDEDPDPSEPDGGFDWWPDFERDLADYERDRDRPRELTPV